MTTAARTTRPRRRLRAVVMVAGGMLVVALALMLALPGAALVVVTHDGQGFELASRPLRDILQRGVSARSAEFASVRFDTERFGAVNTPCATATGRAFGPLVWKRLYNWNAPGAEADAAQRALACRAQRRALAATPGTLAAALAGGDPEAVRRDLHRTLARGSYLAIVLAEVGEPMRDTLAGLLLADPRSPEPLRPLDVALAVGDKAAAERELQALPAGKLDGAERHAFYTLGLATAVARHDDAPRTRDPFGDGDAAAGARAGGFGRSDFLVANAHCDAGYAEFLMGKGLRPTDRTVVAAFVARLARDTPQAVNRLHLQPPYADLAPAVAALGTASAPPAACAALAARYRDVALPADAIEALGDLTGHEMLAWYQHDAQQEMHGKRFATRAEEDAFYDALAFDQKTAPVPALPGMFTALLQGRPSGAAACSALEALPRMLDHDAAMADFKALAESWKGEPLEEPDALRTCRPGLVFPPSYLAQQTRDQNAFLQQAGIACTVSTPKGRTVYNQEVRCDGKH